MRKFMLFFAVALLAVAVLAGCSSREVTITTDEGEKVNVKMGADGFSVKTTDGKEQVDVRIDSEGMKIESSDGSMKAEVKQDGGTVVYETEKDGEKVVIRTGTDVSGLDFPIYEGAESKGGMTSTGAGAAGQAFAFETSDSVDAVFSFYKENMKGAQVLDMRTANGAALLTLENKDRNVSVAINKDDGKGKTLFSITIVNK